MYWSSSTSRILINYFSPPSTPLVCRPAKPNHLTRAADREPFLLYSLIARGKLESNFWVSVFSILGLYSYKKTLICAIYLPNKQPGSVVEKR